MRGPETRFYFRTDVTSGVRRLVVTGAGYARQRLGPAHRTR
jgi:hypothetical protein